MNDGLFTTLDPTARRIELPNGRWCIMSDTVGFIRKLPHGLVNAFKATLESVVQSEVLVIVSDVSDPHFREHLEAVDEVLMQIGANKHERVYVFNKIDKGLAISEELIDAAYPNNVKISAKNKINIENLLTKVESVMQRTLTTVSLELPVGSPYLGESMKLGKVFKQEWGEGIVRVKAELPKRFVTLLEKYLVEEESEERVES